MAREIMAIAQHTNKTIPDHTDKRLVPPQVTLSATCGAEEPETLLPTCMGE